MITIVANTASEPIETFSSILVDVDASATAQPALDRAAEIARKCGARLRIVDVISAAAEARQALRPQFDDGLMTRRREQLAHIAHGVRGTVIDRDVLAGQPAEALIADVERFGHDLLVRSHTRDVVARGPRPFGSVNAQLFRRCPAPVLAIGHGAAPEHPRIAAAIDVSTLDRVQQELSVRLVEFALFLTRLQEGSLFIVHAWQPLAEKCVVSRASDEEFSVYLDLSRQRAQRNLAAFVQIFGRRLAGTRLELRHGTVEDVIPEFVVAEGIDLVVIGTRGRNGIARHVLGNTAERLLGRLPCSVLAVKPVATCREHAKTAR